MSQGKYTPGTLLLIQQETWTEKILFQEITGNKSVQYTFLSITVFYIFNTSSNS